MVSDFDLLNNLITKVGDIVVSNAGKIVTLKEQVNIYPQLEHTASYKSDVDIWRHLENNIWGRDYEDVHKGFSKGSPTSLVSRITKNFDDIKKTNTRITTNADNMTLAKVHRDSIESKLEKKANSDHSHGSSDIINQLKAFLIGGGTASIVLVGVGAFLLLRSKALKKVL
tara:strand:- start:759 stop:1268 length:510 start_codon:yes stop_codon:yes gene_type:complete